jgi:hypothetical protein
VFNFITSKKLEIKIKIIMYKNIKNMNFLRRKLRKYVQELYNKINEFLLRKINTYGINGKTYHIHRMKNTMSLRNHSIPNCFIPST